MGMHFQYVLYILLTLCSAKLQHDGKAIGLESSVNELICRVLPRHCSLVATSIDVDLGDNIEISYNTTRYSLKIKASSPINLIRGFSYYLRSVCNTSLSQFGDEICIPYILPAFTSPIIIKILEVIRYFGNICSYSYSFYFWNWEHWEPYLDWIVIQGFNTVFVPLSFEDILKDTLIHFGMKLNDVLNFFTAPNYLAWLTMGNIKHLNGPISLLSVQYHAKLHQKIITHLNNLGVKVVQPVFPGFVPDKFSNLYPDEMFIKAKCWNGVNESLSCLTQINPLSELYTNVSDYFVTQLLGRYPTNHLYSMDMYNENTPPNGSLSYLSEVGYKSTLALRKNDPFFVWVLQGWTFGYDKFWNSQRTHAYLSLIDKDKLLILDMFHDSSHKSTVLTDKYAIWSFINNYGGNSVLNGNIMQTLTAYESVSKNSTNILGIGYMPEGIYQNTLLVDAVMLYSFSKDSASTYFDKWVANYARRVYGLKEMTWEAVEFISTFYSQSSARYYDFYIMYRLPQLQLEYISNWNITDVKKSLIHVIEYVEKFEVINHIKKVFLYDLVNAAQVYIDQSFFLRYKELLNSYKKRDFLLFDASKRKMRQLFKKFDHLSSLIAERSVPCYIDKLKVFSNENNYTLEESVSSFLMQTTIWSSSGTIGDYAFKTWSSMLKNYYLRRWEIFFEYLSISMIDDEPFDNQRYTTGINSFQNNFYKSHIMDSCVFNQSSNKLILRIIMDIVSD